MATNPAFEVGRLDAVGQADLVRAGEAKPSELVQWGYERIEALNPSLNAIVISAPGATAEAVAPDAPFPGVPFLVKDLIVEIPGVEITNGSRYLKGVVSSFESELAARHRRAGLITLGKTASPEFGMSPSCAPALYGPTRNPWSTAHTTGGSSGGSAAAVAAGIVPAAHGSDAGGSIRYPASCCGLFGLKPTRARNPVGPEYGDALGGLGVEHVLTRSVRDSAALLDATAGAQSGDPYCAPAPARPFLAEVGAEPGRLRIGYSRISAEGTELHPDCSAVIDDTLDLLERLGHVVVEAPFTEIDHATGAAIGTFMGSFGTWMLAYWVRRLRRAPQPGELEPQFEAMLEHAATLTAADYLLARDDINAYCRRAAAYFEDYDLFFCPTVTTPPPTFEAIEENPGEMIRNAGIIANLTGNPAMSVPLFWNAEDLPIGSHFLAPFGDEATLLRLAAQLEVARPWAERWPPISVARS